MESSKRKQLDRFLDKIPLKILRTATRRKEKKNPGGRPKVIKKCPHCKYHGGFREMREHIRAAHPGMGMGKPKGRKKKMRPCPTCGEKFGVVDMRIHKGAAHPFVRKSKQK